MKKKTKVLSFLNPLNKLTREPSLKVLITEKEINKKRNISIDFTSTPFKLQKKIIKRNIRKNSFNNLILTQTEETNQTKINNLSYMQSSKLILNKNLSIHKKNFLKTKFNNNKNKSFNFTFKNNNEINNMNYQSQKPAKPSIIKKNSKNYKINTRSFIVGLNNLQKKYKTYGHLNNNKINNNNNDCNIILNKNIFNTQNDKLNSNENNNILKTKLINIKKKIITNNNNNKKLKKNNKKNLSTNFKISSDDYIKIVKNTKKYKDLDSFLNEKQHSLTLSNNNLSNINDGNIKLLCENIELKRKNEELISKIKYISKEFKEIKKDNNEIKEELKEKNNTLNNIRLTMDIFNQELIRLQKQIQTNNNNNNNSNNLNLNINNKIKIKGKVNKLNIKGIEINENYEKTPSTGLGYAYDKKTSSNEIKLIKNSNEKNNYSLSDENNISLAENININEEEYKKALNKCQNTKSKKKNNSYFINNLDLIKPKQNKEPYSDFNQEFLKNVDNFSESWRKEVEKMMQRKGNSNN